MNTAYCYIAGALSRAFPALGQNRTHTNVFNGPVRKRDLVSFTDRTLHDFSAISVMQQFFLSPVAIECYFNAPARRL